MKYEVDVEHRKKMQFYDFDGGKRAQEEIR